MSAPAEPDFFLQSEDGIRDAIVRGVQTFAGAIVKLNCCVLLVEQGDWIRNPVEPPVSMHRLLLVFWKVTVPEGGGGGPAFTVRVAAVLVAGPAELVNTAR